MTRNPNWTRDELILALDLYFSEGRKQLEASHPKVIALSHLLNQLPIHDKTLREIQFRNANGVSMKLGNFLAIDPEYEGVGLARGSKLEQEVWDEFANQPYELKRIAKAIGNSYKLLKEPENIYETEENFNEGRLLSRLHSQHERNPKIIRRKKDSILKKTGKLLCQVCNFDFEEVYGELGYGFAECHHLIPVAQLDENSTTKLSDLAIVCANCHRMLHRPKSVLTLPELRQIIQQKKLEASVPQFKEKS